ncbi:DUF6193 family natural product biosynthesis protein [Streptomyces sp. NPDC002814]
MNDIVQAQWLRLMENAEDPQRVGRSTFVAPYAEMLQTAYAHRRLQVLFPWTGMWELHFSRCTEQRWTWDIPYIAPAKDGRFLVAGPSRSQVVGYAHSAEDAVGMVVDRLPRGCGRAFVGTPAELADYEDAHMPHVNP